MSATPNSPESAERRYTSKDCCTPCFYDSCDTCRGNGCACQKYNHPAGSTQ